MNAQFPFSIYKAQPGTVARVGGSSHLNSIIKTIPHKHAQSFIP